MSVSSREDVVAAFDALTTPERLALLERLEHDLRRLPVARDALINGVRQQATAAEIGGKLSHVLADRLGITQRRPPAHRGRRRSGSAPRVDR
jgi:hypothetical protein